MSDQPEKKAERVETVSDKRILDDTYFMMTPRLFTARITHYIERAKEEGANVEKSDDQKMMDGMLRLREIEALIALAESVSVKDIFEARTDMSKTRKEQTIRSVNGAILSLKLLLEKR